MKLVVRVILAIILFLPLGVIMAAELYVAPQTQCAEVEGLVKAVFGITKAQPREADEFVKFAVGEDPVRIWIAPLKSFDFTQLSRLPDAAYDGLRLLLLSEPGSRSRLNQWGQRTSQRLEFLSIPIAVLPCELGSGIWPKISTVVRKYAGLTNELLIPGLDMVTDLGLDGYQIQRINQKLTTQLGKVEAEETYSHLFALMAYLKTAPDMPLVKSRGVSKTLTQTVFYATTRRPTGNSAPEQYFSGERDLQNVVHYGTAQVTFPLKHRRFNIESPLFAINWLKNADDHVMVADVEESNARDFFAKISEHETTGDDMWRDSIIVYIHGFNVTFHGALLRTAQLTYDFEYPGVPLLFSWPSDGQLSEYVSDREDATWSIHYLAQLLTQLKQQNPQRSIHLIAHSMGNQVLVGALQRLHLLGSDDEPWFDTIVMAAPDYDAHLFNYQMAEQTVGLARHWAVYVSKNDAALQASYKVNGTPRLGMPVHSANRVQIVDVSKLDVNLWSIPETHSYYATQQPVVEDIAALIQGTPPERRQLHQIRDKGSVYWQLISE